MRNRDMPRAYASSAHLTAQQSFVGQFAMTTLFSFVKKHPTQRLNWSAFRLVPIAPIRP